MSDQDRQVQPPLRPFVSGTTTSKGVGRLQFVLWLLWTGAVLASSYRYMRPALLVEAPVDIVGLVVHCLVVGSIGLVVMTIIEMRLEPWRFLDAGD